MKPRNCEKTHRPPESYGDCIRACIATMLDRDDVPHLFTGQHPPISWGLLRDWLKSIGHSLAIFAVPDPWEFMEQDNYGVPYLLLCSAGDMDHAVVCLNGKVFHDPSWLKSKITGPNSFGEWIVCIIGIAP